MNTSADTAFTGKRVLVTGGTRGIGAAKEPHAGTSTPSCSQARVLSQWGLDAFVVRTKRARQVATPRPEGPRPCCPGGSSC